MKNVSKKTNPTTQKPTSENKSPFLTYKQEYFDNLFSNGKIPVSNEYLQKFAQEWIDTASVDEGMVVMWDFAARKKVDRNVVRDWIKRCPELAQAQEVVRTIIGTRRETGAIKRDFDSHSVFKNQHLYDPEYMKGEEWRASLKAKNEQQSGPGNITVVMERFGESEKDKKKPSRGKSKVASSQENE